MTQWSRPNRAVLNPNWSDSTCVWHGFLHCPKTKGGCALHQFNPIPVQTSFPRHIQQIRAWTAHHFSMTILKHPNSVSNCSSCGTSVLAVVYQEGFFNQNQFQVSKLLRFKRLKTQENLSKRFSSTVRWEGQICECVYNGSEVISVLTQRQMMEWDSGHTCTLTHTRQDVNVCTHTPTHSVLTG